MEYSLEFSTEYSKEYFMEYENQKMEYSRKMTKQQKYLFFWNMEYSRNIPEK